MAYSVDLNYTVNEDFSNPQTISESGKPTSMTLQGLQSNQTYYTKAILKNDGVVEDETEITSFQTLPAGTITLNHYQTTRSGYDYEVVYLYSSTYAPSWARLAVNGSTFQGTFDSAQHAVSFLVTGLTPGTAYLDLVTMGDIYGEEASVQGSIVTTVVNDVDITSVETAYTSADVNVEYIVDGGFYVGYVEWWLGSQDPSTDQSEGHEYFNNGDETVTISNLSSGTEYKFKASITLADQTTTIVSNVVAASTDTDYSSKYFTIKNVSSGNNTIGIKTNNSNNTATVYVSTDDGNTWTSVTSTTGGTTLATLSSGGKLQIKHNGALGGMSGFVETYNYITATGDFVAYGNIASLTNGDDFTTQSNMPGRSFSYFFINNQYLKSAENLYFGTYIDATLDSCKSMFSGCSSLIYSPSTLPMSTLYQGCYQYMFYGCTSLISAPSLPATTLANDCYISMFSGCTSLTTPPVLPSTTLAASCYRNMFSGCSSLSTAPALPAETLTPTCYSNMFYGCTSLTTPPELPATTIGNYCYEGMFSGCTSLRIAPELPATTIGNYCYKGMFSGCTSLRTAPDLRATEMKRSCYERMFSDCTSLTSAPDLPAETLAATCYAFMFYGCTSLSVAPKLDAVTSIGTDALNCTFQGCRLIDEIYAPNVTDWNSYYTYRWLDGVAESGTVYKPADLTIPTDTPDGVPVGWTTEDY